MLGSAIQWDGPLIGDGLAINRLAFTLRIDGIHHHWLCHLVRGTGNRQADCKQEYDCRASSSERPLLPRPKAGPREELLFWKALAGGFSSR
jgi:hypothetical protein